MYPRINFKEVIFQIDENMLEINAKGDLPLYKSHGFELQVKTWFLKEISKREADFKTVLQTMEQNIWKELPFS